MAINSTDLVRHLAEALLLIINNLSGTNDRHFRTLKELLIYNSKYLKSSLST